MSMGLVLEESLLATLGVIRNKDMARGTLANPATLAMLIRRWRLP